MIIPKFVCRSKFFTLHYPHLVDYTHQNPIVFVLNELSKIIETKDCKIENFQLNYVG